MNHAPNIRGVGARHFAWLQFRFRAIARGKAIIVFQHTGSSPTVHDTVVVR